MTKFYVKHAIPVGDEPVPVATEIGTRCRVTALLTKIQGVRLSNLGTDDWTFKIMLKEAVFSTSNVATGLIPEGDFNATTGAFRVPPEAEKYIFDVDDGCDAVKFKVLIDATRDDGAGDPDQGREAEELQLLKCGDSLERDIEVVCYDDGELSGGEDDRSFITFSFKFKSECIGKDEEF